LNYFCTHLALLFEVVLKKQPETHFALPDKAKKNLSVSLLRQKRISMRIIFPAPAKHNAANCRSAQFSLFSRSFSQLTRYFFSC